MSSLDAFLADLDELDEEEQAAGPQLAVAEELEPEAAMTENLKIHDVTDVAKLSQSEKYQRIMKSLREHTGFRTEAVFGPVEADPEYQLVVEANNLTLEINDEIMIVHKFIRDVYAKKFPELESLVLNPPDYAQVVKLIGNEMDLTLIDLSSVLPSATVMVVTVTGSTTRGSPLAEDELQRCFTACDLLLSLTQAFADILQFVEGRMSVIAPNLSTLVGANIAARLMSAAGGLTALSKIPGCNLQVIGAKKAELAGFSRMSTNQHEGHVFQTDIVVSTPNSLKVKAARLVAYKAALCVRVDSAHEHPAGEMGQSFREEIQKKIEKWLEPPPLKAIKALPAPDDAPGRRRGGKRARREKAELAMTELRKQANRIKFGEEEDDGITASGKLRIAVNNESKNKLIKKAQKKLKQRHVGGGSGATSGLASSVAFTPVQGLELENPNLRREKADGTDKYFSTTGSFVNVGAKRKREDDDEE